MRLIELELRNFLSYRHASFRPGDLTAVVGANASGKSNLVSAFKLLRDIPSYGLQTALARRGGFDQIRHRSEGRPYDPSVAITFELDSALPASRYELALGAKAGKRYDVKLESGAIHENSETHSFIHKRGSLHIRDADQRLVPSEFPPIPQGATCIPAVFAYGGFALWRFLTSIQTVEINPARLKDLQDPSPPEEFEPDGSNVASFFENLPNDKRQEVVDQLSAIVPGIVKIEPRHVADKLTLAFYQSVSGRSREFSAKQMSDGTLRAFGILVALIGLERKSIVVIEEPEVAIHLGALRTLVEIFREHSAMTQIVLTTHSADIVDSLDVDQMRVVWAETGASRIANVAQHSMEPVRQGLITPGELLRSDAFDPQQT